MAYCTQTDLERVETSDSIIQLTDDTQAGVVDTDNLTEAITLADGYIDSRLRGHITLPLSVPCPTIIVQISTELSVVNLYKRRFGSNLPETILKRQAWAEKQLDLIIDGKIIINDDQANNQPAGNVKVATRPKVYTEEYLRKY